MWNGPQSSHFKHLVQRRWHYFGRLCSLVGGGESLGLYSSPDCFPFSQLSPHTPHCHRLSRLQLPRHLHRDAQQVWNREPTYSPLLLSDFCQVFHRSNEKSSSHSPREETVVSTERQTWTRCPDSFILGFEFHFTDLFLAINSTRYSYVATPQIKM